MLTPRGVLVQYDLYQVTKTFAKETGWELLNGEWNGKYDKPVSFKVEFTEPDTFRREQDYVTFDNHQRDVGARQLTLDKIQEKAEVKEYKDNQYLMIPIADIVQHLRNIGLLPNDNELLIRS